MNVEFKRDLNHNYIKIDAEEEYFEYQAQMLMRNNIRGLLACTKECVNNKTSFMYEINSKQPFIQVFQRSKMNFDMFKIFISSIKNVVDIMADYLLDVNSLILLPEYMYMDPETKEVELIYLPGTWNEIKEEFHELSRHLLDWIDYKDEHVVSSAYELYRLTGEENYTISDVFDVLFSPAVVEIEHEYVEEKTFVDNNIKTAERVKEIEAGFEEAFDYEDEFEENIEKESVLKRITRPIIEATGNLFKGFSSKTREEKEKGISYNAFSETDIDYDVVGETNFEYFSNDKINVWGKEGVIPKVAEESAGYGETVFFQEEVSGNRRLIPVDADKFEIFELDILPFIIGKLNDAVDGVIKDESVSRIHAKIERVDLEFFLVDLNSTNGTYLNGKIVSPNEKTKLHSGDRIQFGLVNYIFEN